MNLSAIAIKRPVFTVMVTFGLLVLGGMGFRRLGTDLFPDISFPVVAVNIVYPGASPGEVETKITKEVEDAVVSLNGIDRVRTYSRESLSTAIIIFKLGTDLPEAATQVRERIAQIRYKLPAEAKEPTVNRFDVSAAPILTYTLRASGGRSLSQTSMLRKFAEDTVKPALEQVEGVASVEVRGGAKREVHVEIDRNRADALNLDPGAVSLRLRAANLTVPAGHLDEGTREISVRALGDFKNVGEVRDLIIATAPDGSTVRLRDVARVEDGFEDLRTRVRANGEEAVSFEILKQAGQNTVAVSDAVKAKLGALQARKTIPDDLQVGLIIDQARFIKENVHEVEVSIVFGGAMAILIILVFMLDLRSTLISAVALPTSVIGTFFVMYLLGYSLNMMTLLGLSLAIGLLIDDAVVVRENIFKHLERGKPPMQAALDGTKEISLSVLATTLTIVAVFLPVAFVKGMVGQFFRQFGVTVSAAVLLSLFVAFTLDPMLSSRFSKSIPGAGLGPPRSADDRFPNRGSFASASGRASQAIKRPFHAVFGAMDRGYRGLLTWAMNHKLIVGGLAVGSLVFMGYLSKLMGNEFVNAEDRGQFVVSIELPAGTSLDETDRLAALGERQLIHAPEMRMVFATIGPNGETNKAKWRVVASPKAERSVSLAVLKDTARRIAADSLPQAKVSVTDPPFVEGASTEAPIMINVRGQSYADIAPLADEVAKILRTTSGVQDVQVQYSPGRPELRVAVDRQRAAEKGLQPAQVAMALRTALEGEEATKLREGDEEIPIRVRLMKSDRERADDLGRLTIATPRGPIKLGDVTTTSRGDGPQVIEREDRNRQIQIWAAPRARPLGDIVADIKPRFAALQLPAGAGITYDGQIRLMSETNENMGLALLLGVLFIYIVLASQFESFIHPLTIMLTLPLAFVGAVMGLFLTGNTMAMGALIGIILLMGLVTKNAILLIDRAIVRVREQGETPLQAVLEAGPERLRPILMTSAAMILGMLPTAVGNGEGSEFRAPMAIAVIGGVISSTLLSLVVVPAFYLAIEGLKRKLGIRPSVSHEQGGQMEAVTSR